MKKNLFNNIALSFLLLLLASCSSMIPSAPQSINESIAFGYVSVEIAANAVTAAKQTNSIDVDKRDELVGHLEHALFILHQADQTNALVKRARLLGSSEPVTEDAILDMVDRAITIASDVKQYVEGL